MGSPRILPANDLSGVKALRNNVRSAIGLSSFEISTNVFCRNRSPNNFSASVSIKSFLQKQTRRSSPNILIYKCVWITILEKGAKSPNTHHITTTIILKRKMPGISSNIHWGFVDGKEQFSYRKSSPTPP